MELALGHHAETLPTRDSPRPYSRCFPSGLPGYCVFFLGNPNPAGDAKHKAAFMLYALENGVNIVLAFVLYRPLGVRGLALSYSIAYTVAAFAALLVLRDRPRNNRRKSRLLKSHCTCCLKFVDGICRCFHLGHLRHRYRPCWLGEIDFHRHCRSRRLHCWRGCGRFRFGLAEFASKSTARGTHSKGRHGGHSNSHR